VVNEKSFITLTPGRPMIGGEVCPYNWW